MKDWQGQGHVKCECKCHIVMLAEYRRKTLCRRIRRGIGPILRNLICRRDEADDPRLAMLRLGNRRLSASQLGDLFEHWAGGSRRKTGRYGAPRSR